MSRRATPARCSFARKRDEGSFSGSDGNDDDKKKRKKMWTLVLEKRARRRSWNTLSSPLLVRELHNPCTTMPVRLKWIQVIPGWHPGETNAACDVAVG
eukprot:2244344-Amphidinium_carterae.1